MKSNYTNPMFEICSISEEDVIRTSVQLAQGEFGRADELQDIG